MRKMKADSLAELVNMAARLHLASTPKGWHFTNQPPLLHETPVLRVVVPTSNHTPASRVP